MATETLTQTGEDHPSRTSLAIGAAGEIEDLIEVIIQQCGPGTTNGAVRGMAIRVRELASIVMSALDDKAPPSVELERALWGVPHGHQPTMN